MDDSKRPESRADPNSDDLTKSLVEEYLACTEKPVGSRNVFNEAFEVPSIESRPPRVEREKGEGHRDLSWLLVASCVVSIGLIVALAYVILS